MEIRRLDASHRTDVVALWKRVGLTRHWVRRSGPCSQDQVDRLARGVGLDIRRGE